MHELLTVAAGHERRARIKQPACRPAESLQNVVGSERQIEWTLTAFLLRIAGPADFVAWGRGGRGLQHQGAHMDGASVGRMPQSLGVIEGVVSEAAVIVLERRVQLRTVLLQGDSVDRVERPDHARGGRNDLAGADPLDPGWIGAGREAGGQAGQSGKHKVGFHGWNSFLAGLGLILEK